MIATQTTWTIRLLWPGRIVRDAPEHIRERLAKSYSSRYSAEAAADAVAQWARLPRRRLRVEPITASSMYDPCPAHPLEDRMHGCEPAEAAAGMAVLEQRAAEAPTPRTARPQPATGPAGCYTTTDYCFAHLSGIVATSRPDAPVCMDRAILARTAITTDRAAMRTTRMLRGWTIGDPASVLAEYRRDLRHQRRVLAAAGIPRPVIRPAKEA